MLEPHTTTWTSAMNECESNVVRMLISLFNFHYWMTLKLWYHKHFNWGISGNINHFIPQMTWPRGPQE